MEYVKLGTLSDGAIRARGWEPSAYTLSAGTRNTFEEAVNEAVRKAWGFQKWPELMRVEKRRFRPTWDAGTAYEAGQEVFYGTQYWRGTLENNLGNTPVRGSAFWETPDDFIPFVELGQWWETNEIWEEGVDLDAFAYRVDPRVNPDAAAGRCRFWQGSVVLPKEWELTYAWCRFMPKAPRFSFVPYSASTAYASNDVCYDAGSCWRSLRAQTGTEPGASSTTWEEVRLPEMFAQYVRTYLLSQWLTASEGRYELEGKAQNILNDVATQHFERSGERGTCYASGRRRR